MIMAVELNDQAVTAIRVYWDTQDRDNEGWAYEVSGENGSLDSGAVSIDGDANISDVIDQALWDAGIEGLDHDSFAIDDDAMRADWSPS